MDLIESQNDYALKSSANQLKGSIYNKISDFRAIIIHEIAFIESALDDPEHYEGMVESFNILRYALRHRDEKKLYNFITDQHPYSKSSCVDVDDFMGQPTKSMDGAVSLAHKLGMSVVYLGMKCREDGGYTMHFSLIAEDASTVTAREMLDSYYSLLEKDIREQPWNYLWTHKRWK